MFLQSIVLTACKLNNLTMLSTLLLEGEHWFDLIWFIFTFQYKIDPKPASPLF